MKNVAFYTLGCKVNTYESEAMAGLFEAKGYNIVDPQQKADIFIVNTCTVTAIGDKKSRQMIRRAKKLNPNSIVAVTGCYAQVAPDEITAIEGVDIVIGNEHKDKIVELTETAHNDQICLVGEISPVYEDFGTGNYHSRTRATLKIQDGCNSFCTYCIIPYARGEVRSRSMASIIKEVEHLAEQGFVEIVLVGIHLASYGKDLEEGDLISVVERLNEIPGIQRIRLGSLEPKCLTDDFVSRIRKLEKVCPHFHISLQSGCDTTLKRMNRKYNMEEYFEGIERLRSIPDVSITTDVMVGFAGETEEEFAKSMTNVQKCGFSAVHIFPYSKRRGTPAAKMSGQVPESIKSERAAKMAQMTDKMKKDFEEKYIGQTVEVLFEQDGHGHTKNYIQVYAKGGEGVQNVKITAATNDGLEGTLC
ncbi:MAG: tRNA (N(6)-L-threonylcarbamoyladenosine(37)-C(2))-methylthiotransferase MtaB [Eubacteriales bacterium]|nr:tRNA (N(6)-L-threonylcarbamoyladenosine(37)-C(2))-methylthiotransferase MtaB [Eubacteriales bacterium]